MAKPNEEKFDTLLSKSQIPIIDLAHVGTDDCPVKSVLNRVAAQLQKAINDKGIAFLVNHGISEDKLKVCWAHLDDFCRLPADVKELYLRQGPSNHGYVKPGLEKLDGKTLELKHAFNICTLNVARLPEEPLPGFREHIADMAKDFKNLSSFLLQALAIGLELPTSYFLEKHSHMLSGDEDNETTLRLLYYPPLVEDDNKCELVKGNCMYSYQRCAMDKPDLGIPYNDKDDEEIEGVTRCGAHCDYGTFTLLAQDTEGGLEVKLPGCEKWQRVGHLPGSILINTGELLEMWTQEKYKALPHRVIVPEQRSIKQKGRHSLAFFCHPDNCTEIIPIELPGVEEATCDPNKKASVMKTAKNKVLTAYQHIQKKFKESYASS